MLTLRPLMKCVLFSILSMLSYSSVGQRTPLPTQGIVPDEATAVKIAEAVFPPVFGLEEVTKYKPYHAHLQKDVWTVHGSLQDPGARGGTPMLRIQRRDGKILEVWFSQ
jgi:hypothetical protein